MPSHASLLYTFLNGRWPNKHELIICMASNIIKSDYCFSLVPFNAFARICSEKLLLLLVLEMRNRLTVYCMMLVRRQLVRM